MVGGRCVLFFLLLVLFACPVAPLRADGAGGETETLDLLSAEERQWLTEHGASLRYAPVPNYPPVDFVDAQGHHRGVTAEIMALLQKRLGVVFVYEQSESWAEILDKLKDGQVDVVGSIQDTEERRDFLFFTEPYLTIPNAIIVRRDSQDELSLDHMAGMEVAVGEGYASIGYLRQAQPDIRIVEVRDDLAGLRAVATGRIHALIADLAVVSHLVEKHGISNLKVAGNIDYDWRICIGSRRDLPVLHSILAKGLASISEEERRAIAQRWIRVEFPSAGPGRTFWLLLAAVAAGLVLVLAAVGLWNRVLQLRVRERTERLEKEFRERLLAEQALKESEERYRSLFRNNHSVMLLIDPVDSAIVDANPAASAYYGYAIEEMRGLRLGNLNTLPENQLRENLALAQTKGRSRFQFRHRLANGELRDVEVYSGPVSVGEKTYLFSIVHDISERVRAEREKRELEAQLRQSQKMDAIGTMAGGIAHDFNNILTVIIGYAELSLTDSQGGGRRVETGLQEILRAGERARNLVRQILTFSRRSEEGELRVLQPHLVVKEALQFLQVTIPATVEIEKHITARGWMLAEPTQFHQLLMNLCTNAVQAMAGRGRLTISFTEERQVPAAERQGVEDGGHGFLRLVVSDTGCGMDEATVQRIFEPFFTTKPLGEGTGLGLAVVHGIVLNHGGAVSVRSEADRGTEFVVVFPAVSAEGDDGGGAEDPPATGRGGRVLLVDDDAATLRIEKELLESLGYVVLAATDGTEALQLLEKAATEIDILVTDQMMPGLTGLEVAAQAGKIRPGLPVVLCTGYGSALLPEDCETFGVRGVLLKPFGRVELARIMGEALAGNQPERNGP